MTKSRNTVTIPQDLLCSLYQKGMSTAALASYFKCSQDTISRNLRLMQVEPRSRYQQLPIAEIVERYRAGEPVTALAAAFHVSSRTIYNRLKEAHCPLLHQLPTTKKKKQVCHHLPIQELIFLYQVSGLSTREIAKCYHVNPRAITYRLKKAGIALRGNSLQLPKHSIISAYEQGVPIADLAKEHATSYQVIRNLLIQNDCYQKSKTFQPYGDHIFYLYQEEHMSIGEIAKYYHCHRETIRRIIRKKEAILMSC